MVLPLQNLIYLGMHFQHLLTARILKSLNQLLSLNRSTHTLLNSSTSIRGNIILIMRYETIQIPLLQVFLPLAKKEKRTGHCTNECRFNHNFNIYNAIIWYCVPFNYNT
jgi:hypothetical protein